MNESLFYLKLYNFYKRSFHSFGNAPSTIDWFIMDVKGAIKFVTPSSKYSMFSCKL